MISWGISGADLDAESSSADTSKVVATHQTIRILPTVDQLPEPLRRFMDRLSEHQKLLLVLKRDLYDGDFAPMIEDLNNRLAGRPYIFKLASRIEEDLKSIHQMCELEQHYEVDLSGYLQTIESLENET